MPWSVGRQRADRYLDAAVNSLTLRMLALELEQYLHAHIPLSSAMQVHVASVSEETVILSAPLAPNINHRATVFGGSASALAILSAWGLLHVRLHARGLTKRLVIQRNTMDYTAAIQGEFTAQSTIAASDWDAFMRMLARRGKARIEISAALNCGAIQVGEFRGEFVALSDSH
jgi:thioesterase domain-containing protein